MSVNNIEKVNGYIMSIGRMSFFTHVKNGSKNPNNDMRRDSCYYRTYPSENYANVGELNQLDIKTQSWLVFRYEGYDENNKFFSEEIFMNGKSIDNFRDFLDYSYDEISSNSDKIYGKGKVNKEYEDFMITTGYEEDGSGFGYVDTFNHTLYVYPQICFTDDNKSSYNGIVLGIQTEDGEQYEQEMSLATFFQLVKIIDNYNLFNDSRLVMIEGMLYQLLLGGNSITTSSVGVNRNTPTRPVRNMGRKPIQRRQTLSEAFAAEKDDEDESEESSTPTKTVTKTNTKKVVTKSTPVRQSNSKSISMEAILNDAENEDLDLDDEDGEEY